MIFSAYVAMLLQDQSSTGMEEGKCDADIYKGIPELPGKCELLFNLLKSDKTDIVNHS